MSQFTPAAAGVSKSLSLRCVLEIPDEVGEAVYGFEKHCAGDGWDEFVLDGVAADDECGLRLRHVCDASGDGGDVIFLAGEGE